MRCAAAVAVLSGLILSGCSRSNLPDADARDALMIAYAPAVPAQELESLRMLSLEKAQEIAKANNPDFLSTAHLVNAARMRYYQSLGSYLPEIRGAFDVGQTLTERTNIVNPLETTVPGNNAFSPRAGLSASYLLFDGFARELNVLIQRKDEKYAESKRADVLRILTRAVAYAYYDVQLAIEFKRIAQSDITFQESVLNQASVRHRNGFIAKGDFLGFKIDLARAHVRYIQAEETYLLARYVLSCILGFPGGNLPESIQFPPISTAFSIPGLGREFYLDEALQRRPDLAMDRYITAIRRYSYLQVLSTFFPTLSAYADYTFVNSGDQNHTADGKLYRSYNSHTGDYGVRGEWLLFNGFRRYNRYRELKEVYQESKLTLAARQLTVLAEVESAYTTLNANRKMSEYYRDMLQWVFEQRYLVEVEYWAGNVTITRLRGAQNDLVTSQCDFVNAIINIDKAKAQLAAAVGVMPEFIMPDQPNTTIKQFFDWLEQKVPKEDSL